MNAAPPPRPVIAVFDFDGTLTRGDSLRVFLRTSLGWARCAGVTLRALPQLVGFALGIVPRERAKEAVLVRALGGMPLATARALGERFAAETIPQLLKPAALERLHWHQGQGHPTYLLSASPELYLTPWAERAGMTKAIATRLEVQNDRLTGRLDGANCYGPEKTRRLAEHLGDLHRYEIHAYGDSAGDRELLAAADTPHYREF